MSEWSSSLERDKILRRETIAVSRNSRDRNNLKQDTLFLTTRTQITRFNMSCSIGPFFWKPQRWTLPSPSNCSSLLNMFNFLLTVWHKIDELVFFWPNIFSLFFHWFGPHLTSQANVLQKMRLTNFYFCFNFCTKLLSSQTCSIVLKTKTESFYTVFSATFVKKNRGRIIWVTNCP